MPSFSLEQIKTYTKCQVLQETANSFTNISTDTRKIEKGMLFLAIKGEKYDGHDFIATAINNGATGIIISDKRKIPADLQHNITIVVVDDTLQAYLDIAGGWRQQFKLPLVAVTGSNGKTTTKDLTAAVLAAKYNVLKTQKNFNSEIGMALTLLALRQEHNIAVIEMGMRGLGQITALAKAAKPEIGIVLNVGHTHLELLGSQENIAKAKAELPQALPQNGKAVLNNDDEFVRKMAKATAADIITFAIKNSADIKAENIRIIDNNKTKFNCILPNGQFEFIIPLIGEHNVYDALAAIAIGYIMQMPPQLIQEGLNAFKSSGMRFEMTKYRDCTIINDAYNASPVSMKASIKNIMTMAGKRRIVVCGDMKELGSIEKTAHEEIGVFCVKNNIDILITLGPLAKWAAQAARDKAMQNVYTCEDHLQIAKLLTKILQAGDIVLIKGSHSMQMEKIISLLGK